MSRSVPNPHPDSANRGHWATLRFALRAIEVRLRFIAILVAIGLFVGYWDTIRNHWEKWTRPAAAAEISSDSEFYCPMHPNVVRPGLEPNGKVPACPICGMPLSKRKKGDLPTLPPGVVGRVQLSPERVQLAGIQTTEVRYRPLTTEVRAVGYVDYDESRQSQIVTRVAGYVEKLYVDKTFATVEPGEKLAEIYSPELYSAAQELLLATKRGAVLDLADISRDKLRLLGISDSEIEEIVRTRQASPRIVIRSPQQGHVIRKEIVEGSSVSQGDVLFEVADLSTVWIEADVFEKDIAFLQSGQAVEASVDSLPNRTFDGRISLVHPHLDRVTRTNRVRFEVENPRHELRPGMYATVRIAAPVAEIEPFQSQIARRRTRPSPENVTEFVAWQQTCPVTGLKLGSMGKPIQANAEGQTLFLCCQGCVEPLGDAPQKFLAKLAPPPADEVPTVPERAVIDTGSRQIVYVEREPGLYEGVEVELGPRAGEFYPVISGVSAGDRVAAAGAFLIDAETRLNPAAGSTYFGATGSPGGEWTGATRAANARSPAETSKDAQPLSPEELRAIEKLPEDDRKLAIAQKLCPITDEPLGSMGTPVKVMVKGEAVFLCCKGCTSQVEDDPEGVMKKVRELKAASEK